MRDATRRRGWARCACAACAAAMAPCEVRADQPFQAFTEEAVARGVNYSYAVSGGAAGWGVAFGDLDGDGDPDLVAVGQPDGVVGVWENDGTGMFASRAASTGIGSLSSTSSVLLVDVDDDGDLDLFIGRFGAPTRLYRNDGAFAFAAMPGALPGESGPVTGCTAGDLDGDGDLDLYVTRYGVPNRLFANQGGGAFLDLPQAGGAIDPWNCWQSVLLDADGDGDLDVYTSNDKKVPTETTMHNRLYRNDGGVFVYASAGSGADINAYSMGVAVGDVNNDGIADLYCANLQIEASPLLLGAGDGTFVDATDAYGVHNWRTAWATIFADFDNDGHEDLFVANFGTPNRLFRGGPPPWEDVGPMAMVSPGTSLSHCAAVADIDGDGDLDLAIQNNGDTLRLLVNHEGSMRSWTRLHVPANGAGAGAATAAVGASVAVRTGGTWQHRWIRAGGNGFKGQNDLAVHVGLGGAAMADEVVVRWPDGVERSFSSMPANTPWTLWHPVSLGDLDGDGVVGLGDLGAFLACASAALAPGCERADLDGDFVVDAVDLVLLLDACVDVVPDCDGDGMPDPFQILDDPALDGDGDGAIDRCAAPTADLNGDGTVDGTDMGLLLGAWGQPGPGDLDGSGAVDAADLGLLLGAWG